MQSARLLLPFTYGMNSEALEQAVLLAKESRATLVPASLIRVAKDQRIKGPRLEFVQQSKDFLEGARSKAQQQHVPIEPVEVYTADIPQSIDTLARKLCCTGIIMFVQDKNGLFLSIADIQRVMAVAPGRMYLFHLASKECVSLSVR